MYIHIQTFEYMNLYLCMPMPMRIYVYKYHQILYLSSSRCKRDRKWMGTSEACGHHFHRHCLEKALAAGTRGCPLCRRTLRSPEGGPVGGGTGRSGRICS